MTDDARRGIEGPSRGGAIPHFSLTRPVTVLMAMLALMVLGVIAYNGIKLEMMPAGFTPPFLYVQIPTLRSSPEDIEERIAIPAEEYFVTLRNLERLGTRIDSNSAGFLMEFADGTDMDAAYNQVRDRVERLLPQLGDDIGRYFIWKYNPTDEPVIWAAVTMDEDVEDPGAIIDQYLAPRLERIPGVSRVDSFGQSFLAVDIDVDDRLAAAAGTNLWDLVQNLSSDNFALAGGEVDNGEQQFPLRIVARYESVQEIRALPVGNGLSLDDIADVDIEDRAERAIYRVNGRPSMFIAIYKESGANSVDVSAAVHSVLDVELAGDVRTGGAEFAYFFDQGELISESLANLQETAVWGGVFAILVLMFFLRRIRITVAIAIAIPMSMLATLVVMYLMGRSLNVFSLMGLMLAVGMVVDNAIVVSESIQRHLQAGMGPFEASLHGTAEVALAILVATLTTIIVFLPMILMSGNEMLSFLLSHIGFPVCIALLASLVVSLVFLPLIASRLLVGMSTPDMVIMRWMESAYAGVLKWLLRRRLDGFALVALAFFSVSIPQQHVVVVGESEPNINDFRIHLSVPESYTWEETVDAVLEFESAVLENQDELGIEDVMVRVGGRWGRPQIRCFLRSPDERSLDRDEIIERATSLLPELPGVSHSLAWDQGGAAETIRVSVTGPDSRRLAELAEEVARRLRTIEGIESVQTESSDGAQPELLFTVDRESAQSVGLSPMLVGGTIDFALRGRQLPSLRTNDFELPVYIQGDIQESRDRTTIDQLQMPTASGRVTLGSVAESEVSPGFQRIERENRRTVVSISIFTTEEDLRTLRDEIDSVMASVEWPRGYGLEFGDRFMAVEEDMQQLVFVAMLSILFVFLLMGILFESFVLPFSILLSIPFAFVGVQWALYLTDTPMDQMAGVGLIILVGIVVNNAIVLVDLAVELRRRGWERNAAVIEAGRQRLRPILMTALTTIFGLIPMATGEATVVGVPYAPLGRSVIGGLAASTVLTLFVVPLFYTLFEDMRDWTRRIALAGPRPKRQAQEHEE